MHNLSSLHRHLLLGLVIISHWAIADDRLDKIRATNTLIVGYETNNFPFTYHNPEGKVQGFSVELVEAIRLHLSETMNLPQLSIKAIPIDDQNRFNLLNEGKIDITCSTNKNLESRKQLINFSNNYFVSRIRLAVPTHSNIDGYKDLEGKKVAVERSTDLADLIEKRKKQFNFAEIVETSSAEESLQMLLKGEVDGVFESDIVISSTSALSNQADKIKFVGAALGFDHFACMMPKNNDHFKAEVDQALSHFFLTGKIDSVYQRWFLEPIQTSNGKTVTLNFELSSGTQALYSQPNDRAVLNQ